MRLIIIFNEEMVLIVQYSRFLSIFLHIVEFKNYLLKNQVLTRAQMIATALTKTATQSLTPRTLSLNLFRVNLRKIYSVKILKTSKIYAFFNESNLTK